MTRGESDEHHFQMQQQTGATGTPYNSQESVRILSLSDLPSNSIDLKGRVLIENPGFEYMRM